VAGGGSAGRFATDQQLVAINPMPAILSERIMATLGGEISAE
jgi:hypothetical protein